MQTQSEIKLLTIVTTAIVFMLALLIISLLYAYRKKQLNHIKYIHSLKLDFDKNLLNTQIEVQEQTFQHISREIHDNINLSLTLAKLNLNTLDWDNYSKMQISIKSAIDILGTAIVDLSNLSKSTSTDLIKNLGLINAINHELQKIQLTGNISINYFITGEPVFLTSDKDLIIFRIIQEAFNNIIKHSLASSVILNLNYHSDSLDVIIEDNGKGFEIESVYLSCGSVKAGLKNMYTRTELFGGEFTIESQPGKGTKILFKVPYNNDKQN